MGSRHAASREVANPIPQPMRPDAARKEEWTTVANEAKIGGFKHDAFAAPGVGASN